MTDLKGKVFERLTVIERAPKPAHVKTSRAYWKCECECENIVVVAGNSLQSGNTKSCGCLARETAAQIGKNKKKDLTNMTFGRLKVLKEVSERSKTGKIKWQCECECGSIIEVDAGNLISKNTQSCGCLKSRGELEVAQVLNNLQVPYSRELRVYDDNGNRMSFDFCIYDNNKPKLLIEYQGSIHYEARDSGWNTSERLEENKIRDEKKRKYCIKNNIPLLEIPYWEKENIKNLIKEKL